MKRRNTWALAFLVTSLASVAYGIDLTWYTIDGGGTTSGGGQFQLSGTIGQPDAGVLVGGGFELSGGFWSPSATPLPCVGDIDGDNQVGLADLSVLLANFGTAAGAAPEEGDLDGDGDIDLTDLSVLLAAFGAVCP